MDCTTTKQISKERSQEKETSSEQGSKWMAKANTSATLLEQEMLAMVWRHDEAIVKSHQNHALKFNFPEGRPIVRISLPMNTEGNAWTRDKSRERNKKEYKKK